MSKAGFCTQAGFKQVLGKQKKGEKMRARKSISSLSVILSMIFLGNMFTAQAADAKWQIYRNPEFNIEFLTISVPKEKRFDSPDAVKVIWHIGFMEDGTNGMVDATRLRDGSLRSFSVTEQASDLRKGMEQSVTSKVVSQKNIFLNSIPAIEFRTTSTTKNGSLWYGVTRILVIEDTLYSIIVACPNKQRTFEPDIVKYLDSFKKNNEK
jgi:hypothetical protein